LQENVVNKKRELLPDLSPTFPCLFALPLFVTFPPRIAAEKRKLLNPDALCRNINLLPFRFVLLCKQQKNLKPVKVIS